MSTLQLDDIPTLSHLYAANYLSPSDAPSSTATPHFTNKISLIRADITTLAIDAIVNAANSSLLGGGGVDGAIHHAAGPKLFDECETLEGCDTGNAKITSAYRLPCKKVIHAVGPVYYSAKREGMHTTLLQSCYTTSLDLAVENGCRSIAFSALSTGVYGYPSREACRDAIEAVKGWLEDDEERAGKMDRVIFCQFMEKDQRAYEEFAPHYFTPLSEDQTENEDDQKDVAPEELETQNPDAAATSAPSTAADDAPEADATKEEPKTPTTPTTPINEPADDMNEPVPTTNLPDLPDVPTKEPALAGEPEVKKLKLSQ